MSDALRAHGLTEELTRLLCSWGFSRQEYWSGKPFPSLGDLSNPGIKSRSPSLKAGSLPAELPGKPKVMWTLDHKKGWVLKNWYFELWCWRRLLRVLHSKEMNPVNPKGNQSWIFIGRTNAYTEAPILWLPVVKSQLIRKDPDAWKDWRQEKKGVTEDKMVGWHHGLLGHEVKQALQDSEGQGCLMCCRPWGQKESDMT